MNKIKQIKSFKRQYSTIRILTVFVFLVLLTSPKIYSQAQDQRLFAEGRNNLCTPHTNITVDSPSTTNWANLSASIDSASHHANIGALQNFTSVTHQEIYTSVDAVVLMKENSLRSEFIINPGADMHHIMLTYNRARNIKINNSEELVHDGEFRRFTIYEPLVFQIIEGDNTIIDTNYKIDKDGIVSFDIADYEKELPLIIVPSISEISEFADYNSRFNFNAIDTKMAKLE